MENDAQADAITVEPVDPEPVDEPPPRGGGAPVHFISGGRLHASPLVSPHRAGGGRARARARGGGAAVAMGPRGATRLDRSRGATKLI